MPYSKSPSPYGCASTPALRRLVAQTSLEPRHLVLPMFVADGIDEPRADRLDARSRSAHPGFVAPGRRRRGRPPASAG